jgi:hypothetical protein
VTTNIATTTVLNTTKETTTMVGGNGTQQQLKPRSESDGRGILRLYPVNQKSEDENRMRIPDSQLSFQLYLGNGADKKVEGMRVDTADNSQGHVAINNNNMAHKDEYSLSEEMRKLERTSMTPSRAHQEGEKSVGGGTASVSKAEAVLQGQSKDMNDIHQQHLGRFDVNGQEITKDHSHKITAHQSKDRMLWERRRTHDNFGRQDEQVTPAVHVRW